MVLGCLRRDPAKDITDYLLKVCRFLLSLIHRKLESTSDKIFSDLKTQIPKPSLNECVSQDWISDETWAAMNARFAACQEGSQQIVQKLIQWIRAGLSTD